MTTPFRLHNIFMLKSAVMDVVALWLIYLIVVIVLWMIFWYPAMNDVKILPSLFYAFLIGFLFIYLANPAFDTDEMSDEENAWLNALIVISVVLPLVIIGIMIANIYQRVYDELA